MGSRDQQACVDDVAVKNIDMSIAEPHKSIENLQCFVCDAKICGRHYALATCRTQSSRSRVIEKLGELVGERYMVVISEDDVICRSCANLINTLDRLESEMRNVRDNVLRFLEQKYSLEEGELGNNDKPRFSQPPQITKCNDQDNVMHHHKKGEATFSIHATDNTKNKKNNVWMQCDKCRYTTLHNAFMIHHIRDHIKQKMFCDKCGIQFPGIQKTTHDCILKEQQNDCQFFKEKDTEFCMQTNTEDLMDIASLGKTVPQNVAIMPIGTLVKMETSNRDGTLPLIRLPNSDNTQMQNILASETNTMPNHPIYVRVLQHDASKEFINSTIVSGPNLEMDLLTKSKDDAGKQMLTLTESGSLEMVEVTCWNDTPSSDPGIAFQ
ncbi:hypothetical protein KM043_013660 [Ampulex compressa]|nr:hypothetical protein KM043_013660 [Ampulex compressa]